MALKVDRKYDEGTSILYIMNEVAERGIIVVASSSGTGAPGDANNVVRIPTAVTDLPIGLLLTDVVSLDLSQVSHRARLHRDEVPVGSPVTLLRDGWVFTDQVDATALSSISMGETAYFNDDGELTNVSASGAVSVGQFLGDATDDDFVKVDITLGS